MRHLVAGLKRSTVVSRRSLLAGVASGAAATLIPGSGALFAANKERSRDSRSSRESTFVDLIRPPDRVVCLSDSGQVILLAASAAQWKGSDIIVSCEPSQGRNMDELPVCVTSPSSALTYVHLRWKCAMDPSVLVLGDHWERSYGDLAWRGIVPERVMPWYFVTYDQDRVHGYGVKTAAQALCFWPLDPEGVSLWLNISNGGSGVRLGERNLLAATIVTRMGLSGENAISAVHQLCRRMCTNPRLPGGPIYGSNDWDYAYGKNTQEQILRDVELVASLAPRGGHRPFSVIDDGWQNKTVFPDMARLAEEIRQRDVHPGIWVRPLIAPQGASSSLLLPSKRFGTRSERASELAYDPTIPEGLEIVRAKLKELVSWRYELVKHDYSTYDLLGQWGFEMGARPALPGWHFNDQSRTNAEIIRGFYAELRAVAGEQVLLLGCNTVGHLAAGLFESQRIGDDTSGLLWERTRRMGVNTLAFRLPQHRSFFWVDPDMVAIAKDIPWNLGKLWLDLVAHSGTSLFVSMQLAVMGPEQRAAVTSAFAAAASGQWRGRPADWFQETTPETWNFDQHPEERHPKAVTRFAWSGEEGALPFEV